MDYVNEQKVNKNKEKDKKKKKLQSRQGPQKTSLNKHQLFIIGPSVNI